MHKHEIVHKLLLWPFDEETRHEREARTKKKGKQCRISHIAIQDSTACVWSFLQFSFAFVGFERAVFATPEI